MRYLVKGALAGLVVLLSACGGGGDGGSNADPQGIWTGPATTGYTVNAALLDNGEIWGIYSSGGTIYGALFGNTSVSGNRITVSGTDFNFLSNSATAGTLTGSFSPKASMGLSSPSVSVSLAYSATYETPATAAAIAGTWSFIGRSSDYELVPGSITVDGSGNFTLSQTNCTTSGSIVPRPGGKNIYNVTLTSSGSSCAVGTTSLAGIAYLDTSASPNRFLALGLTSAKDDGLIVIGTKAGG